MSARRLRRIACLGSLLIPYAEAAGHPLPPFDFSVPGVTSLSCDQHKYGFAPKGSSTVLFRDESLRHHMYTTLADWSGGIYASATQAGSRPGGLIAGCWSALVSMGASGYKDAAVKILTASHDLKAGLLNIPQCEIVGEPALSVVAFTTKRSSGVSIFDLLDSLCSRGWDLNPLQNPSALHVCVTLPMVSRIPELVADIKRAAAELADGGQVRSDSGKGHIYGMATKVPTEIVDEVSRAYLDEVLAPPKHLADARHS
jgi:sphinganine-1-phosphate aldolase